MRGEERVWPSPVSLSAKISGITPGWSPVKPRTMSGRDPGLPGVPDPKVNHPGNITIYVARKKWEYDLEAVQYAPGSSITSTSTRSGAAGNAQNTWTAPREVPIRWIDRGFRATSPLGHNTRGALPGRSRFCPWVFSGAF